MSCGSPDTTTGPNDARTAIATPTSNQLSFVERARDLGLDHQHVNGADGNLYFFEVVGPGVALFDADGDGDLDVYVAQGHALPARPPDVEPGPQDTDRLFRNELDCSSGICDPSTLRFVDVTELSGIRASGYGMGATVGDANSDGRPDLYVTNYGPNELWLNLGDLRFELAHRDAATEIPRWSTSALFFDFDRDGDHDLFEVNYVDYDVLDPVTCSDSRTGTRDYCGPQDFTAQPERLFEQRDGRLQDVSSALGFAATAGKALGVVDLDVDGDGRLDLFVANDLMENHLWVQTDDGFEERAALAGLATNALGQVEASMGIAVGDVDGDGLEDLFSAHLEGETNTLYRNLGNGVFMDFSQASRLGAPSMAYTAFGTTFVDFDLDGTLDVALANGAVTIFNDTTRPAEARALEQPNQLFLGLGGGRFDEATRDQIGADFFVSHTSRGLAAGDLDNDGDLDLVVTNNGGPLQVLLNQLQQGAGRPWAGFDVRDRNGSTALGATIEFEGRRFEGQHAVQRIRRADSFLSSRDPRVLAPAAKVTTVRIAWPDGAEAQVSGVAGSYLRVEHPSAEGAGALP